MALLEASSAVHEAACRTDDVALSLATAVAPVGPTAVACVPYAPPAAAAVLRALGHVAVGPTSGLGAVAVALEAVSLEMRSIAQHLEAAGAVGLLATGGLGLLRGERPTVLASADGVDLRREAITGGWSSSGVGGSSGLAVRQVKAEDGPTIYVVEATTSLKEAWSLGIQVNGVGLFAEGGTSQEVTLRWAVPTERDAELMAAAATAALIPKVGKLALSQLPKPTEATAAVAVSGYAVAGPAAGTAVARVEVTTLASGGQRFAASVGAGGSAGLWGVVGAGGSTSAKVTVDRSPAGAVTGVSLSTSTEADRGRHGNPLLEAGNRGATLVERTYDVELTPERRAAGERVAAAMARGEAPDQSDLEVLADGARHARVEEHTYDVRHQQGSLDVSTTAVDGGAGVAIDTATLRR